MPDVKERQYLDHQRDRYNERKERKWPDLLMLI